MYNDDVVSFKFCVRSDLTCFQWTSHMEKEDFKIYQDNPVSSSSFSGFQILKIPKPITCVRSICALTDLFNMANLVSLKAKQDIIKIEMGELAHSSSRF